MDIGILHTHTLIVVVWLLLFSTKAVLLFLGKEEPLTTLRNKTKVVEMILGFLLLATGSYLMVKTGAHFTWHWVKLVGVIAAIPLGIVGLKKSNKALTALSLFVFLYFYGVSETRSLSLRPSNYAKMEEAGEPAELYSAATIYTNECTRCHGPAGDAMAFKAMNLKESKLNVEQIKNTIAEGRGTMKGYAKKLSAKQLDELAEYVNGLKE